MLGGSRGGRLPGCASCGAQVERLHRYCPWCAAPQRRKLVEFFRPHPRIGDDARALRVSRYLGGDDETRHTRFSIWDRNDSVAAAVSLDDDELARLAQFLADPAAGEPPRRARWMRTRLRG
jgi:hypothetical protein